MKLIALVYSFAAVAEANFFNPILSGFHPDPSCIHVDNAFFCVTSTFTWSPGVPVYTSTDLRHWTLVSHVLNRREQLPQLENAPTGQDGLFASTIRHHNNTFYVTTTFVSITSYKEFTMQNLIFSTNNLFNASSWSIPTEFNFTGYDPSLFFDDDSDTVYLTGAAVSSTGTAIALTTIDIGTGVLGDFSYPWNGTGLGTAEGPHLYKKDNWYYILVAEGGTKELHRGSISRSRTVYGPYESNPANPIVAAEHLNSSYIQTVGHADIFQDKATGHWWGVALAMRSGAKFETYPMGRETVLFPVSWSAGEGSWPRLLEPVRGQMMASLPGTLTNSSSLPGIHHGIDVVDFASDSVLPSHWVHIRYPNESAYSISLEGHANSMRLGLSSRNLSSMILPHDTLTKDITFVGRRQTETLFSFSVDLDFDPQLLGEEAGISVYLDEKRHIDFSVAFDNQTTSGKLLQVQSFSSNENVTVPQPVTLPLPSEYRNRTPIRLEVLASNTTHYTFLAGFPDLCKPEAVHMMIVGHAGASLVSGGYTGVVIGVYGTTNGQTIKRKSAAYVSRWRTFVFDPVNKQSVELRHEAQTLILED
ncbi:xylosidase : arabinofuranosidase [Colletotrichum scovillei]|uniref:Xylosidase: arabinofuranosidase n=1 Tax=Colletotrichum scovillei TaxID=1209932 RepID=A0A9P7R294_9PEZI|nr:xylosidase : arabinofuranosidase [Colletotrichum scovillei]KAG7057037.1 xylosidase : arabinofuranosidase [Colletotrichum scovillei]